MGIKLFFLLLSLVSLSLSEKYTSTKRYKEIYEYLKKNANFKVYSPEENPFRDYSEEDLDKMIMKISKPINYFKIHEAEEQSKNKLYSYPDEFNFLSSYNYCSEIVKNQAHCGSCWSMAVSSSLGYRFCKKSEGSINLELGAQRLVSCVMMADGCNGGWQEYAFDYIKNNGIFTEECYPYVSHKGLVPTCSNTCTEKNVADTKYYATPENKIYGLDNFKQALYDEGPIAVTFKVYADFYQYKGEVYKHHIGELRGLHAVTLMGWGVERGEEYFLLQNSWGKEWGIHGFFKMEVHECDMLNYGADTASPIL